MKPVITALAGAAIALVLGASAVADDAAEAFVQEHAGEALRILNDDDMPLADKIDTIARRIYRAEAVQMDDRLRAQLATWEDAGFGQFPICMAKTQYSFTTDPDRRGAPAGFALPVRDLRLSAGAGFVVAICGAIMTMPGLPRTPAAESIGRDADGNVAGLF